MKKIFFKINYTGFAALFIIFSSLAYGFDPEYGEKPKELTKIEYLDGRPVNLDDFKGHPTILYFGADWCGPCRDFGRPAIISMWGKYKDKGLRIIYVNADDNSTRPNKITESENIGFPIAMAKLDVCPVGKCPYGIKEHGSFGKIYMFPSAFILNADGIVTGKLQGGKGIASNINSELLKVLKP